NHERIARAVRDIPYSTRSYVLTLRRHPGQRVAILKTIHVDARGKTIVDYQRLGGDRKNARVIILVDALNPEVGGEAVGITAIVVGLKSSTIGRARIDGHRLGVDRVLRRISRFRGTIPERAPRPPVIGIVRGNVVRQLWVVLIGPGHGSA